MNAESVVPAHQCPECGRYISERDGELLRRDDSVEYKRVGCDHCSYERVEAIGTDFESVPPDIHGRRSVLVRENYSCMTRGCNSEGVLVSTYYDGLDRPVVSCDEHLSGAGRTEVSNLKDLSYDN